MDRIICTSPNYFATSNVLTRFESKVEVIPIGIDQETIVFLDMPLWLLTYRVVTRTWRRHRQRELLWGTNYEKFWNRRLDALEAHLEQAREASSREPDESDDA